MPKLFRLTMAAQLGVVVLTSDPCTCEHKQEEHPKFGTILIYIESYRPVRNTNLVRLYKTRKRYSMV